MQPPLKTTFHKKENTMIDIAKAKRLLAKINVLVDHYDEAHSRLESDLLKSYIKELYEAVLDGTEIKTEPKPVVEQVAPPAEIPTPQELEAPIVKPTPDDPQMESNGQDQSSPEERFKIERDETTNERESEIIKDVEITPEIPEVVDIPISTDQSEIAALFDLEHSGDLLSKLGSKPVHRIESAMGINERIFTINELFGGDHDLFQITVSQINDFETFDQAKNFLIDGVATKMEWASAEKTKKASNFIRLIWRKFAHV